jgi:hypothetical protein
MMMDAQEEKIKENKWYKGRFTVDRERPRSLVGRTPSPPSGIVALRDRLPNHRVTRFD